jgi:hypothetical protein
MKKERISKEKERERIHANSAMSELKITVLFPNSHSRPAADGF